jgi:hypothetical protein
VEKIAPKNQKFYQDLKTVSGTFASPENGV